MLRTGISKTLKPSSCGVGKEVTFKSIRRNKVFGKAWHIA